MPPSARLRSALTANDGIARPPWSRSQRRPGRCRRGRTASCCWARTWSRCASRAQGALASIPAHRARSVGVGGRPRVPVVPVASLPAHSACSWASAPPCAADRGAGPAVQQKATHPHKNTHKHPRAPSAQLIQRCACSAASEHTSRTRAPARPTMAASCAESCSRHKTHRHSGDSGAGHAHTVTRVPQRCRPSTVSADAVPCCARAPAHTPCDSRG